MFIGPVGPVEVFFYWPEAVFGKFYWPGAIGSPLASSPGPTMIHIKHTGTIQPNYIYILPLLIRIPGNQPGIQFKIEKSLPTGTFLGGHVTTNITKKFWPNVNVYSNTGDCLIRTEADPKFLSGLGKIRLGIKHTKTYNSM